ncbi:MAG: Bifunctional protein FolD [Dehalococcoidia bacterium]|nr:Bifunctional protein FolD [Dehalococcoidia bacterium]
MSAQIIDGTKIAQDIRNEVAEGVKELQAKHGLTPGLAVVLVGDNPASAVYVRNKGRACQEVGMFSETFKMPQAASQEEVLKLIGKLNHDDRFHGILVQLPLPPQIDERRAIFALDPAKDVDGLHPVNVGHLVEGAPTFIPCTPAGAQQLLLRYGYSPEGKNVVVCGRSNIVGKPISILLMQKNPGANATVTICHTGTKNLAQITDMVKEGVVVIDVGINAVNDPTKKQGYHLEGDVDFEAVSKKAAAITPVPGGVGPMTIAMLLSNTLKAAQHKAGS